MKLVEKLGLRRGDVVSVVGAGGKTTLILRLARELAGSKVLVATTTRMYFPNDTDGFCFLSGTPDRFGKATPYSGLNRLIPIYDYTLIEADGAKCKLLKGWAEHEPVIIPETTKTVGVLNLSLLGERAAEENIHRLDEFTRITGAQSGEILTIEHMRAVVANGLFKKAVGERILCVIGAHYDFDGVDKCVIF